MKILTPLIDMLNGPYWKAKAHYWKEASIQFEYRSTVIAKLLTMNEIQKQKQIKKFLFEKQLAETLPIELTNGNDGRGNKWFSSAKIRKDVEKQLRELGHEREPFEFPVVVHVTRLLGPKQRLWDTSSIGRGNWKEIEDALVVLGWFSDDSPKYISETRFFQNGENRTRGPAILVEIFKAKGENDV